MQNVEIINLLPRYRSLRNSPPGVVLFMQEMVHLISSYIGRGPIEIKKFPEHYIKFNYIMLKDMECFNNSVQRIIMTKRPKLFTLSPVCSIRPKCIKIDNSVP